MGPIIVLQTTRIKCVHQLFIFYIMCTWIFAAVPTMLFSANINTSLNFVLPHVPLSPIIQLQNQQSNAVKVERVSSQWITMYINNRIVFKLKTLLHSDACVFLPLKSCLQSTWVSFVKMIYKWCYLDWNARYVYWELTINKFNIAFRFMNCFILTT